MWSDLFEQDEGQWPAVGGEVEAGAGLEVVMNEALTQ